MKTLKCACGANINLDFVDPMTDDFCCEECYEAAMQMKRDGLLS